MISYCSEEHRMLHRPQHMEICETITNVSRRMNNWNTRFMSTKGWAEFKEANKQCIEQNLRRNLKPYEVQMFLFAKSCIICRKQSNLSIACDYCLSVNVCLDHYLTPYEHNCLHLMRSLNLDIYNASKKKDDIAISKALLSINQTAIHDMISFIQQSMQSDKNPNCWTLDDYIYADAFSKPLTLYHGMRFASLSKLWLRCDTFIVHIIAGSCFDKLSILAWKIVSDQLYRGTKLQIVMIEPDLQCNCHNEQVCDICFRDRGPFQREYHRMYYYDFANSIHMRPDVIVGFNMEIENNEKSKQIVIAVQRQRCPFILTSTSDCKALQNIKKIQEILNLPLIPIVNKKNAFASCRPYRDYTNDSVFFLNQHLVIYLDLITVRNIIEDNSE